MTIQNMKAIQFNNASLEDWQEKASASLKGKPIETLYTSTYEDITLKPLYTKEDFSENSNSSYPGYGDFRRGVDPFGYQSRPWQVANKISYETTVELQEKMEAALSKGQTAISFDVKPELFADHRKFISFLSSFSSQQPFTINAGHLQAPVLAALILANKVSKSNADPTGFVASDPISEAVLTGGLPKEEDDFFQEWSRMLEEADKELPELKTVMVNTSPFHNAGANAVQELAVAISTGVYLVQKLLDNGWDLKKALSKMIFHFAIGSNFFMETAKLRAARLLWNKTMEVYGAGTEQRKMDISAETSMFTKTVFDPYVNMLRTGNEAFAAVLGGIQYLHTGTFDEITGNVDSFSERIARNTQLILKSEAHLEKVADPAGGSWYIEALTRELAENAWNLFLELDSEGGIYEALKTGWLQELINQTADEREKDIFKRKKSIIGTNVYANLSEHFSEPAIKERQSVNLDKSLSDIGKLLSSDESMLPAFMTLEPSSDFTPLIMKRLAEPYEQLRFRAEKLAILTGSEPSIGLICLGELKKHKARADFISGLLAAGGIHSVRSEEIADPATASKFIKSQKSNQFVICGDGADYTAIGPELAENIKKQHPAVNLYLAGMPEGKEEDWKAAGIKEFIHLRSDAYEILSSLMHEMEVGSDAKA